jgi:hypothetical protein
VTEHQSVTDGAGPKVIDSSTQSKPTPLAQTITQGENKMAEVDTTQLSQEHGAIRHDIAVESARLGAQIGAEACGIRAGQGDIRSEQAENFGHTRRDIQGTSADIRREQAVSFGDTRYNIAERAGDIRREVSQGFGATGDLIMEEGQEGIMATKDARYDLSSRITNGTDRVTDRVLDLRSLVGDRFYSVGHDLAGLAQGQATLAKDVELNALKSQLEGQKNTQFLSDKISLDGEKTRSLINDLKYHDLNRGLVERQTELVNCEQDRRHYRDRWDDARFNQIQAGFQGQWAQLQSQIQAFQSQLQETRQGMVNFGTMAGVGQSSTSNNVR